ncbi:heme ABC transporter ATP-binding protein [Saccharospirillum impatiens]|uniref:heme ABC transporter ATP-binding protein n=1 Tax=Saccharospirillum impatiens TaxID=169438 RepID=UPI0004274DC5|nr:heme ABC transporter ATP-binding protein [Saccharospirillum impatiens]
MTLRADQLTLSLTPGQPVLSDVSIAIEPGHITALVGQNGAGKSSLLNTLSGELTPQQGEVSLHDTPIRHWDGQDRARLLAVLPQQHALNFEFNVEEVVALGRYPHATGRRRDNQIVQEALELCDLHHLSERSIDDISGGERQRVHLARVLAQIWESQPEGPCLLLLDEPTTGLDLSHQQALLKAVQHFARRKAGILLVVHDLNLAARYADQVVLMHQGSIVERGTPDRVFQADTLQRYFDVAVTVQRHPHHDCPLIIPD